MQIASEKALEFDTIRLLLAHCTISPIGRALAEAVEPSEEAEAVRLEQSRVSLVRRSRQEGCELGFEALSALKPSTTGLKEEKPILEPSQLYALAASLQEASANRQLLESEAERLPGLAPLAEDLEIDDWIAEEITSAVDPGGKLLDDASPALRELRQALRSTREVIHKELERFFDEQDYRNYVQEEFITIRGGRLVIPIKIEHRGRHRGIVHDRSRSGDSLFFEPIEAVEQNNQLAELQAEVELEEARVLARLTAVLYDNWDDVVQVLQAAARLDLLAAKARFADLYEGIEPTVAADAPLEIIDGRHPLLDERLRGLMQEAGLRSEARDEQPVVPTTIEVGDRWRVLVVTGPNAGGKTVALKTAGLLAMMVQAGLPAPARRYRGPSFRCISADIGDYQDIMSHLSSFSSHLTRLKRLLEKMEPPALVLLDEIAAATDPGEGSVLAMAVIEELRDRGAMLMVTTHLEAIKAFAHAQGEMENACVELDEATKRPTYKLRYGLPGSSNALETAREIGLPAAVVERAQGYLGEGASRATELIGRLQEELSGLQRQRRAADEERRALEASRRHYVERLEALDEREARILEKIDSEWRDFKRSQERAMREALVLVKAAASEREARELVRTRGASAASGFEGLRLTRRRRAPVPRDGGGALAAGDEVELPDLNLRGKVTRDWRPDEAEGRDVAVEVEGKRLSLPRAGVARAGKGRRPRSRKGARVRIVAEERTARTELNLIGKGVDEALRETERFLDEALLHELPWVRIVHGRGTGALRRAIGEHLESAPHVDSWHPAEPAAGGDGVTVVELSR